MTLLLLLLLLMLLLMLMQLQLLQLNHGQKQQQIGLAAGHHHLRCRYYCSNPCPLTSLPRPAHDVEM